MMGDVKVMNDPRGDTRIVFPGGEVTLSRIAKGSTWVHVYVGEGPDCRMADLRIDHPEKHSSETAREIDAAMNLLPLRECYHLAVLVEQDK